MADREKGKNMRISVAMATYNGARFITEQLDSIRLQSLPVDQVILRDDGSSDQTLEIVREYLETYELAPAWRITQNGKRLGYAENFRAAVEETGGDYVFFCDQDDIWEPDRVEDMVSEMEKRREILVLGSEFVPFTVDPDAPSVSRSVLKSFRGVPDKRLEWLRDQHNPKKFTPAVIEFVDIAGLVKGASKGEGLGNKFLANIRGCDAIVHVVRCFDDANVTHVEGSTDPLRDIDIINTELIMADLEMIDRRIDKAQKNAKGGDKRFNHEVEVFTALRDYMNEGNLARTFECSEDDAAMIATSDLLTLRKTIYAANLSENDVNQPEACKYFTQVQELAAKEGSEVLPICAKLEADIAELDDPDEKAMFMEELGLQQSGLDRLIQCSYELLGLISFLTAGADECRAWTIKKGTKAPQAAGKIHSDFERGFIRAEVIAFDDLKACGTLANAKAKGLLRSEGKEYIMHDGDVVNFLFNV